MRDSKNGGFCAYKSESESEYNVRRATEIVEDAKSELTDILLDIRLAYEYVPAKGIKQAIHAVGIAIDSLEETEFYEDD